MNKIRLVLTATGLCAATGVLAGTNGVFLAPVSAPTLHEIGLGLLVVLLGAVGGFFARRKK